DITLDAATAHPRLEILDDGKSVKDAGRLQTVPYHKNRFNSLVLVLAKEGFTSGRHYWEVDVGKLSSFSLGVAQESVIREGIVKICPENGFWVIKFGLWESWAYTVPWTPLNFNEKLRKIGVFLDIPAKKLSFFDVKKKKAFFTFNLGGNQEVKFIPLFSPNPTGHERTVEPIRIVEGFDDEEE
ncbi:TRI39 ligase, partial [Ceuthmochares aereus]|nr:TRI39 ligase [Ceuthmochares aereus]